MMGQVEEAELLLQMHQKIVIELFRDRFEDLKNLFGIYSPVLHDGMNLAARLMEENGDIKDADRLKVKAREFNRILRKLTDIRVNRLAYRKLEGEEKLVALSLFKDITSLPDNDAVVEVELVKLPFYKKHDLYRINFLNTTQPVIKYVLSDLVTALDVDHTNAPIYELGTTDLELNEESVIPYATFFFDSISGRQGRFYLLYDHTDLPWMEDVNFPEGYKEKFQNLIFPIKIISDEEDKYILRGNMIFKNSVFDVKMVVIKDSGFMSLDDEKLVTFYEDTNHQFGIMNEGNNGGIVSTFDEIPACVDPIYETIPLEKQPETLLERVINAIKLIRRDLDFLHPAISRNDQEELEFQSFKNNFETMIRLLNEKQQVRLNFINNILIYNYNTNVLAYNELANQFDYGDKVLTSLRDKMNTFQQLIEEIEEIVRKRQ